MSSSAIYVRRNRRVGSNNANPSHTGRRWHRSLNSYTCGYRISPSRRTLHQSDTGNGQQHPAEQLLDPHDNYGFTGDGDSESRGDAEDEMDDEDEDNEDGDGIEDVTESCCYSLESDRAEPSIWGRPHNHHQNPSAPPPVRVTTRRIAIQEPPRSSNSHCREFILLHPLSMNPRNSRSADQIDLLTQQRLEDQPDAAPLPPLVQPPTVELPDAAPPSLIHDAALSSTAASSNVSIEVVD